MRRAVFVAVLLGLVSDAQAADNAPYVGVWDCGVGQFTFTNETYNPGDSILPALEIDDRGDGAYLFSFADDYQIGISLTSETTMIWSSGASGDQFDCTRLHR